MTATSESTVLDSIAKSVREKLEARKALLPFRELLQKRSTARKPLPFYQTFLRAKPCIISEIKFKSPAIGLLKEPNLDDAIHLAREYLAGGASALSILTEEDHFHGSLSYLKAVREACPTAVILMKDFILEDYQILEGLLAGADGVLLIVALLGKEKTEALMKFAAQLGLGALVEVHNEAELKIALELRAPLIGINNRNLKTLEVSLQTSYQLMPLAQQLDLANATYISESGIKSSADIKGLLKIGFSGFLIGSHLMTKPQPGNEIKKLKLFSKTEIKVCGLTRFEDAALALKLGAWSLGFIFYSGSKRAVTASQVSEILENLKRSLPENQIRAVGVFVNPTLDEIRNVMANVPLQGIQLHGNESVAFCQEVKALYPNLMIIKAARLADYTPQQYHDPSINFILVDHQTDEEWGGTGQTVDWQKASQLKVPSHQKLILAGGLDSNNAQDAIFTVQPYALDLSSGLETSPGVKSAEKLNSFFALFNQ